MISYVFNAKPFINLAITKKTVYSNVGVVNLIQLARKTFKIIHSYVFHAMTQCAKNVMGKMEKIAKNAMVDSF